MSTSKRKQMPVRASGNNRKSQDYDNRMENSVIREVKLLVFLGVCILLFLGNFGWAGIGDTGINWISNRLKGLIGIMEYVLPVYMFISALYMYANPTNRKVRFRIILSALLGLEIILFIQFLSGSSNMELKWSEYYKNSMESLFTAGAIGGKIASLIYSVVGLVGGFILLILGLIIICILLTEKSFVNQVKKAGQKSSAAIEENIQRNRQNRNYSKKSYNRDYYSYANNSNNHERKSKNAEERKSANGMSLITLENKEKKIHKKNVNCEDEMHELFADNIEQTSTDNNNNNNNADTISAGNSEDFGMQFTIKKDGREYSFDESINQNDLVQSNTDAMEELVPPDDSIPEFKSNTSQKPKKSKKELKNDCLTSDSKADDAFIHNKNNKNADLGSEPVYEKPPYDLLKKNDKKSVESDAYLREMGMTLQRTLQSFGVNVTVTNVSCGPSVTRYELQPEQGVKVSKITNLADDIKLNLAVSDIRIEAPIPGKAAVGIEVPNRKSSPVLLRELLENKQFEAAKSSLTFAVGKDISGNIIFGDIAKMPHLLVAGATGSGKSVCINTIIMSLLYKADPKDVKLILIDPKVVELSIYNGIPHMFIPVVTDPKKAAGALNWAVVEMDDRYNKMSEMGVRDLEGYNRKVEALPDDMEDKPEPFSRLVIIVDELADLMMVCGNEVEAAICRLAQKARAAGIHLILATQRPSVDVITGLIKANMPSRIAFAVSSGVDSRTIIDINGAEKLLGKGDMLFYPSSYPKPVRVQGAFVSDKEVADVVEFLSEQNTIEVSAQEIEQRMNAVAASSVESARGSDGYDDYFVKAGEFVIEKGKASTSMIQRVFKVGFNRAARIVSQLEEAGVVGPEEGTKPRKVIMSQEEFEQFVEESV